MGNSRADVLGRIACVARIGMVMNPSRVVLKSSKRRWRKRRKRRAGFCGLVYVPSTAFVHVFSSHGAPLSRAHLSTSRCPSRAALAHVCVSHVHPFARAHSKITRLPLNAALAHVFSSHGHLFARAHFSVSNWPFKAQSAHSSESNNISPFESKRFIEVNCSCSA